MVSHQLFFSHLSVFHVSHGLIEASRDHRHSFKKNIYNVFSDYIASVNHLDDCQRIMIDNKMGDLIDAACFNLAIKNPMEGKSLSVKKMEQIAEEISNMILAVGNPFPLAQFVKNQVPSSPIEPHLQALISAKLPSFTDLADFKTVKAILIEKNPLILEEGRNLLKQLMIDLYDKIKALPEENSQTLVYESAIAYLLSIFSHLSPLEGEEVNVPQMIEGHWSLCRYKIEKMTMTPLFLGSPIYAYGMKGVYDDKDDVERIAPPHLVFKGTTYPTDDGAFLSVLADITPFCSVGEYAFRMGEKKIKKWLDDATGQQLGNQKKARLAGMSLGGSLVTMTAQTFANQIDYGYAYNPPALREGLIQEVVTEDHLTAPKVRILWQNRDLIPFVGSRWNRKWEVISVLGEQNYNPFLSHCKGFVAEEGVIMVKLNNEQVNQSRWRRIITAIYSVVCLPIFSLLAIVFILYRLICEVCKVRDKFNGKKKNQMLYTTE
ncbi:MAG: hypothetical protein ACH350_05055 [Parachlamydiaceae bacterium]